MIYFVFSSQPQLTPSRCRNQGAVHEALRRHFLSLREHLDYFIDHLMLSA